MRNCVRSICLGLLLSLSPALHGVSLADTGAHAADQRERSPSQTIIEPKRMAGGQNQIQRRSTRTVSQDRKKAQAALIMLYFGLRQGCEPGLCALQQG